ncbi:anti-CBASS protein Acb1 family protein, partial [Alicyclobacillus sendaiensis]|uniref:anti-CBASS protein Acb1 family protein n=1 Tax=Alicyclobacillus sendaiensis TaxID=192387 RepID=UPI0026F43950
MQKLKAASSDPNGLTLDEFAKVLSRVVTMDAFSNPLARLGYGTPNLIEGTEYPLTRLTQNYQLLNSLYRNNWIVRRVVDIIPEDMCRNWITLHTQIPPEALDKLNRMWRAKHLKQKILQGLKWGRLYGGAAGLMLIEGHEDILDEPLDYDTIMPGAFKGLQIVDRW